MYIFKLLIVTDFLNEHPFNKGSESSSPAAKRARREPSIVDATEDEQIQAALKASLTPHTVIIDSDSDIETFSGSEDEDDNSFSSPVKSLPVKKSSSPVKSSPNKNNTSSCSKNSCDDNSESESTNNRNESRDHMNSISSDNSEVNNTSSCDNLSESHTYYLGKETGIYLTKCYKHKPNYTPLNNGSTCTEKTGLGLLV